MKINRDNIFNKYHGHCAYCGDVLKSRWHIDHIEPVVRDLATGEFEHKERHTLENLNPSCPSCNRMKNSLSIEDFRWRIGNFAKVFNEQNASYRMAKRYGLIAETDKPVVFYFEKVNK